MNLEERLDRLEKLLKLTLLTTLCLAVVFCLTAHQLHSAKRRAEEVVAEAQSEVAALKAQLSPASLRKEVASMGSSLMSSMLATMSGDINLIPSDPIGLIVDNVVTYNYGPLISQALNVTRAYQKTQRFSSQFEGVYNVVSLLTSILEKAQAVQFLGQTPPPSMGAPSMGGKNGKNGKADPAPDISLALRFPLFDYLVSSFDPDTLAKVGRDCAQLADNVIYSGINWSGTYPVQDPYAGADSWDANSGIRNVVINYVHPICASLASLDEVMKAAA